MNNVKIIGISGKRESGKSTLANFLGDYGYTRISLARLLKEKCKLDFGLTEEQVNGQFKESPTQFRKPEGGFYTPRDILIRCGAYYRSIDPVFWCKALKKCIAGDVCNFVIDDIRFLNEIVYFRKLGAKFVRLERDQAATGKKSLDDPSETELDNYKDWDGLLLPPFNRNLEDLHKFADYVSLHV